MKQVYSTHTLLRQYPLWLIWGITVFSLLIAPTRAHAQFCDGSDANAGNIKLDGPFGNPLILNPDSASGSTNIFIGESYDALSGTPEILQFKDLTSAGYNDSGFDETGIHACNYTNLTWHQIYGVVNGDEPSGDLSGGPACGPTDLINDGTGNGYGYFTIIDQDCNPNTSSDAYLVVRMRIAKESSGAFGFSMLVDTDQSCSSWSSGNGCNDHCFERELWLGTGGGQVGLHIKDVSNSASPGTEIGVIPIGETQVACTAEAPAECKVGNHSTIFYTFAVPFTLLGVNSGDFNMGLAPATSTNPDDIIDGNFAFSDIGGVSPGDNCECTGLTGDCLRLCQLSCAAGSNVVTFPVDFISFSGKYSDNQIDLAWSTARELNNQKFVIERLNVARQFMPIGEVAGNGTTDNMTTYQFEDINPLPGSNFYRLRQVDFDGQFQYSATIEVRAGENDLQLSIHPNVVSEELSMSVYSPETMPMEIQVFSSNGQLLFSHHDIFRQGTNWVSLPASSLTPGIYFVRLIDKYQTTYKPEKFLKF